MVRNAARTERVALMPYKSLKQAAKFHELLKQGKINAKVVDEFDRASKGLKFPERVPPKPKKAHK